MDAGIQEHLERLKLIAQSYKEDDEIIYVKDFGDNMYFGNILSIDDKVMTIDCTGPKHRAGQIVAIEWIRVIKLEVADK